MPFKDYCFGNRNETEKIKMYLIEKINIKINIFE